MVSVRKATWAIIHQTVLFVSLVLFPPMMAAHRLGIPTGGVVERVVSGVGHRYQNA